MRKREKEGFDYHINYKASPCTSENSTSPSLYCLFRSLFLSPLNVTFAYDIVVSTKIVPSANFKTPQLVSVLSGCYLKADPTLYLN